MDQMKHMDQMKQPVTITFDFNDWIAIKVALYREAGEIAAQEARRTGGRGFASGGKLHGVEILHRISDTIKSELEKSNAEAEAGLAEGREASR